MAELDFNQARFNMIEQQIRPWDVLNQRVLDLLVELPREDFVPAQYRNLALSDVAIPLAHGEAMMQPKLEARILQCLEITPEDHILEIGTGSGFLTACLAKLGDHVTSVDIHADLVEGARNTLHAHGIHNVTLESGDASQGWPEHGPYDAIAVTASLPEYSDQFRTHLKVGGRLLVIAGKAPAMEALLITRTGQESWSQESLFETVLPALHNVQQTPQFLF